MNRTFVRVICLVLCLSLTAGLSGCFADDGVELVKIALEALAENEEIQQWMAEHDPAALTEEAIAQFRENSKALREFLAREDVQEKFQTVGLPMIKEFLSYTTESMRLKAETLGNIIRIFAPELTEEVDAIFETAPETTEIPENT